MMAVKQADIAKTLRPLTLHAQQVMAQPRDRSITLGKAWLVSCLQAVLQTARILLPARARAAASSTGPSARYPSRIGRSYPRLRSGCATETGAVALLPQGRRR